MKKASVKVAFFLLFILAFEIFLGWRESYAVLKNFAQTNVYPPVFVSVMTFGCAVGLPVSWCYFFAATAFGIWGGWVCCLFGIFASSLLGFCIAKLILPRTKLAPLLKRFNIKLSVCDATYHANFFIRAIPGVPYFLQNLILADIGTPLKMYSLMTMLVQGPISLAVCFFADSVSRNAYANATIAIALVISLAFIHRIMMRIYLKSS